MERNHVDVQREYEQWDMAHKKMTDTLPSEGGHYIQHALNLLDLLEPIAEIHPIAKAAVGCFKQLVSFEHDRRENDARVAGVILAQTAMMRVLLDIDDLTPRHQNTTLLRAMVDLPQVLCAVQEDITNCHIHIDTYYKEHRLVKFCKAKDWKAKMLEFIEKFDKHRLELHQSLSLQVASDVSDLVSKMNILLERLFSPHKPWEVVVSSKIRELDTSGQTDWMKDTGILQSLAIATRDPSSEKWDVPSDLVEATKLEMQLNQMKEDLQSTIDVLSKRNMELFGLKLKLHTEQVERAILRSARFIVSSLSGPHDRLEHEDLRKLWKEMNWIFCVETKVFGIALFEYYLDLYSKGTFAPGFDTGLWMPKFNPITRYKSGSFKHPQAWTLLYLFVFAEKISNVIDSDHSGLIRISEANAFTSQIPEGWTLPQWCAYLLEGQFHEQAIYRKRLIHIRNILHELNPEILPDNRYSSATCVFGIGTTLLHYLVLQPRDPENQSQVPIAPELHELVKAKILTQDAKFRNMLQSIKWEIEDESTIEVLSSGRPLETYIFPLLLVLMEFWLDLHHLCKSEILDFKEWIGPYFGILSLKSMTETHIKSLQKKFEANKDTKSKEELQTYHRGTWVLLQKTHEHVTSQLHPTFDVDLAPLLKEDYDSFYSDLSFIAEFPLPEPTGLLLQKKCSTWDEFTRDKDVSTLPERKPLTWQLNNDNTWYPPNDAKYVYVDLPLSLWFCNKCRNGVESSRIVHCIDCSDFDFCRDCYFSSPPAEHALEAHNFSHMMLTQAAWCTAWQMTWLGFTAHQTTKNILDMIKPTPSTVSKSETDGEAAHSKSANGNFQCQRCINPIVYGHQPFYVCVEYSCRHKDIMLCDSCAWTNDYPGSTSHHWWHTLLLLDSRVLADKPIGARLSPPPSPTSELSLPTPAQISEPESSMDNSNETDVTLDIPQVVDASLLPSAELVQNRDDRILSLERKVGVIQVSMEERMGVLEKRMVNVEGKLDALLGELQKGVEAILAHTR